jgi:hypothetical protein
VVEIGGASDPFLHPSFGQARPTTDSAIMLVVWRSLAALLWTGALVFPLIAQNVDSKPLEPAKAGDPTKDAAAKHIDEITDASRAMTGPAARAECIWLGERAVGLMWRDDLDTAFRHLDLYDRFGCPGEHVQISFRCVVRQGNIDPKATETFNARVHSCWLNPALVPPPPTATTAEKSGTK